MATEPVPAKHHHQPLHNFSLPFLKWGQRLQINHHCRRNRNRNGTSNGNGYDSEHNHTAKAHRSRTDHAKTKIDEQNGDVYLEKRSSKVCDADVATAVDGDVKPWNLRPRRFSITGDGGGNGGGAAGSSVKARRMVRGDGDGGGVSACAAEEKEKEKEEERKKKRRLWISLSKEEIEEDIYAFTGAKPARRPKKRNRTVQKLLDNVFPGLYLVGISADSYRV